jgi:hypothetical protein
MSSGSTVQSKAWRGEKVFRLFVVLAAPVVALGLGGLVGIFGDTLSLSSFLVLGVLGVAVVLVVLRPNWGAFVLLWLFFFNDLLADFVSESSLISAGKILGIWVLLMWILRQLDSEQIKVYVGAVGWLGVALSCLALVSGLVNGGAWLQALLLLVPGVAFYILIVNQLEDWRDWEVFGAHLIVIGIVAGLNLLLRLWLAADINNPAILRFETVMTKSSVLNDPNNVALYLASVLPLAITQLRRRGRLRVVLWLVAVLLIVGVVATSSRGGTLALGVSLLVLSLRFREARVLLLVGVVIVLVVAPHLPTVSYLYERFLLTDAASYRSYVLRLNAFKTGLQMGLDKPLLGTGPFLWVDLVDKYAVDATKGVATSSHSIWVQAFSELGFPGLLLTGGLFLAGAWNLWRVWRYPDRTGQAVPRKWAMLAFLLSYMVAVTFLNLLYSRTLFMVLGVVVAYGQLEYRYSQLEPEGDSIG